jgi:hypothetical protein
MNRYGMGPILGQAPRRRRYSTEPFAITITDESLHPSQVGMVA